MSIEITPAPARWALLLAELTPVLDRGQEFSERQWFRQAPFVTRRLACSVEAEHVLEAAPNQLGQRELVLVGDPLRPFVEGVR